MDIPFFEIKNKFQKQKITYSEILNHKILEDISQRLFGIKKFKIKFDNTGYNKGRLIKISYKNQITYVSLSEQNIQSRNSPLQSFPTALNAFLLNKNLKKRICFYFLPAKKNSMSFETNYFIFMYRLMNTLGVEFINDDNILSFKIEPFTTLKDLIKQRDLNSQRNRRNKSTYITKNEKNEIEIYGKTYGANKYETTLLALAINNICSNKIVIFQISEGNLNKLPAKSIEVLSKINKIELKNIDLSLQPEDVLKDSNLRTPAYVVNLLKKLGNKKCSLCNCRDEQIIQGAHIWPVADILKLKNENVVTKMNYAKDGENGIWLCFFHHQLFDKHLFFFDENGKVNFKTSIKEKRLKEYLDKTPFLELNKSILTEDFLFYLRNRNKLIVRNDY